LQDISASIFRDSYPGWFISLGSGEKALTDPSVFAGMLTWTTFNPATASGCFRTGTGQLYALAIMPVLVGGVTYQVGAGLLATSTGNVVGTRSVALGAGISQTPVYSIRPRGTGATDSFISSSGGAGVDSSTQSSGAMADSPYKRRLQAAVPSTQVLHWWDQRVR
jgi:hypothetical protein